MLSIGSKDEGSLVIITQPYYAFFSGPHRLREGFSSDVDAVALRLDFGSEGRRRGDLMEKIDGG